jgi:tripartite-type tricarboxylate transporter receptor subunit TctC
MIRRQYWLSAFILLLLSMTAMQPTYAADYPDKPVTIISDAAAGSAPDVVARFVADGLGKVWERQVVVVNRPGANGSVAAHAAADAVADGYTIFHPTLSTFVASPTVAPNIPIKLPRDFLPVGFTALQPMFIAVSPTLGVSTLPELIALAKKDPEKLTIAVTGVGRFTHMTGILLQERAGIKLTPVPYTRGPASAIGDVADGRVSLIIEGYAGIAGAIKAGQIKLIAVASSERLAEFADLPTVAETIPGFVAAGWQALVTPVGTPAPVITKISGDLAKIVSNPDFKEKLDARRAPGLRHQGAANVAAGGGEDFREVRRGLYSQTRHRLAC